MCMCEGFLGYMLAGVLSLLLILAALVILLGIAQTIQWGVGYFKKKKRTTRHP